MSSATDNSTAINLRDAEPSPSLTSSRGRVAVIFATLLAAGLCSFLWIDYPVSKFLAPRGRLPGDFAKILEAAEHFGTTWGQFLILWVVFVLDRANASRIPRVAIAPIIAGLFVNLIKLSIGRLRPKYFEFDGNSISDSFTSWLPFGAGGSEYQSFPSGHTASAFAFAVALGWAYPRGRTVFLAIAGLVALQRIESTSHFISDTLVGAAIGWTIGCWVTAGSRASRWWDVREAGWRKGASPLVKIRVAEPTGERSHLKPHASPAALAAESVPIYPARPVS